MDKELRKCKNTVIKVFVIRCILCFVGKSEFPSKSEFSSKIVRMLCGNEVLADLGNELFIVICFLAVLEVMVILIGRAKNKFFKNTDASSNMHEFRQGNGFLFSAITAFAVGIVFIGCGAVFAYYKIENLVIGFMLAAGILAEIAAICFGFLFHEVMKQINLIHSQSE